VEKRLWRDVIKTAYGNTVNPTSSSVRTFQQYYKKLLLPYECHVGGSTEVLSCLSKIDNSAPSRHASTGSPCGSQISTDGESNKTSSSSGAGGEKLTNHLSEVSLQEKADSKKPPVEGRMNGETLCAAVVEPGPLLDGEHVVERVNSQGNSVTTHLPPSTPGAPSAISGPVQTPEGSMQNSTNGDSALKSVEGGDPKLSTSTPSSGSLSHMANMAGDNGAPPSAPLKSVNSTELDNDRGLDFPDNSRDSYPRPELSDPLPEMSVQEAESVLGMSPTTYPNHDGPATPSTGVPSPSQFPSAHSAHFQKQPQHRVGSMGQPGTPGSVGTPTGGNRGGSQDYNVEGGGEIGGASSTSGVNANSGQAPSSYPPPYPNPMDVPGGYPPHHIHPSHHPSLYSHSPHPSGHGYPPYNNPMFPPNRQYGDMPGDYSHHHPGMTSGSMIHSPYSAGRGPYHGMQGSGSGQHRNSVDYHHPHHQPHHGPYPHPQMMGGVRDVPPYPSHGMSSSEWQWQQQQQQRQQIMSAQQSQMYQRMQQHHQQQQHAAMNAMRQQQAAMSAAAIQQQQQHSNTRSSPAISSTDTSKMSWQHHDQSHATKSHPTSSSSVSSSSFSGSSSTAKLASEKARSSPKPHPHLHHAESMGGKISQGSSKLSDLATGPPTASSHASSMAENLKRSLPDWSNCVEGTKPQLVKRRRLFSYHCGKPT